MVTNDYGKLAYLKIAQLEKKIQKLESLVSKNNYSELEFIYENPISQYTHAFLVDLNALKDGVSTVKLTIDASLNGTYSIEVKVNEVQIFKQDGFESKQNTFSIEAPLNKGNNVIKVSVECLTEPLKINVLKVNVGGFVEYLKVKNYLSTISINNKDYFVHLKGENAKVYSYCEENGLIEVYNLTNLIDAKICGGTNEYLYILYINKQNFLYLLTLNLEDKTTQETNLNVSSCSSAAGYPVDSGIKVFYSQFAKIYSGIVAPNQAFTPTFTGRKGLEVYADANTPNAIVIVDNFLNAKFITD